MLTPAPVNFQQKIRSELAEALGLGYGDIIPSFLHLRATMGSNAVVPTVINPGIAYDIYRVSGAYTFLVSEIRAHIALNQLSVESTTGMTGNFTGLMLAQSLQDRIIAKACNAFISLYNPDRNDLKVVETNIQNSASVGAVQSPLPLATLMPQCGGGPLKLINKNYVCPLIIPANERIQLRVQLMEAPASTYQTEYGVVLIGALVRAVP